ncbi:MAG: glycosyltransferase [Bacteroidota bacterium]|nr:glycosyltransferase [Bacteroidota bacterium]
MIKVSVIIPSYNRTTELCRAIKSVLSQTVQEFEIYVIDDCSDVNTEEVIHGINDHRIKYIRLDEKGNANVCRNLGIKMATGEYIAMLDSDDEWLPEHLERKLYFLEKNKADGVFGSCAIDNGFDKTTVISRPFYENELMINYLLTDGIAYTPSHLYKAACVKEILWDESLLRHQDFDFSVRFARKYKFLPSQDITSIVHWKKGETRVEDFLSQIKFIKMFSKDIKPEVYNRYHRNVFLKIYNRKDIESKIVAYFKKESVKHFHYLSFNDYISVFGKNSSAISRFLMRFHFILRIVIKI